MELEQAIDDFLVFLRVRRQLSPRTVKNYYGYALQNVLAPWCRHRGLDQLEDLTDAQVDRFSMDLEERKNRIGEPLHLATRVAYLKALKHFLAWGHEQAGAEVNADRVGLPRLRRLEKDVLSREEMQALEDAASNERDKLMIRLMVETGARVGEVAAVQLDDLVERDRRSHFVRLGGKTGRRLAPITADLDRRLRAYAEGKTGRPRGVKLPWLFVGRKRRNSADFDRLTESGVYRACETLPNVLTWPQAVHPHLLRASAVPRMCADGNHPGVVSLITGVSVGVISTHYLYPSQLQTWEAAMKSLSAV